VVLRADKRGAGESEGDEGTATTTDYAADARAGLAYLESRPEVDGRRIGVIGHSEGGLIACMLAARNPNLAFAVLMAAPGMRGWELAGQQARRQAERYGLNPDEAEQQNIEVATLLRNEQDDDVLRAQLDRILSQLPEPQRNTRIRHAMLPWQRHFAGLNPAEYLRETECPLLALNGEKDCSVEPASNLAGIRAALMDGGHADFEIVELPGLNHLFQTCTTGFESEYWHIQETLSPVFLDTVTEWLTKHRLIDFSTSVFVTGHTAAAESA
jgi:hypothetical protein